MKKIVFVCSGNTCRSPMAEKILKHKLRQVGITGFAVISRGLNVTETAINPFAKLALTALKIKCGGFTPRQLSKLDISNKNLIVCMTSSIKDKLIDYCSCYTIGELTDIGEISDPYGKNLTEYKLTAEKLNLACEIMLNKIIKVNL